MNKAGIALNVLNQDKKMGKKLSAKDLGVDLTRKCKYCGEKLHSTKVEGYSVITFDLETHSIHVCDQQKVLNFRREFHELIRETTKKQADILKLKDVDENQLRKRMDI